MRRGPAGSSIKHSFQATNGELEKCFQHAFAVAEKFFPRWEVEKARIEKAPTIAKALEDSLDALPKAPPSRNAPRPRANSQLRGNRRPRFLGEGLAVDA